MLDETSFPFAIDFAEGRAAAVKIEANGVRYSVDVQGAGEPLLLLHGFTGTKKTWAKCLPEWTKRFQTIAVDIVGHGESDSPEDVRHYKMEAVADALEIVLDRLGVKKTHVVGYSMGGRLALYFTIMRPHRIGRALLESASPGLETPEERRARAERDDALADRIVACGLEAFVDEWENLPLFATQRDLPEDVRREIRRERLSQNPIGLAGSLRGMGTGCQPSLWDALPHCQTPITLVVGALDEKFVAIAERMAARLPRGVRRIVDGCGHAVHVERPDIFAKIVIEALSGH